MQIAETRKIILLYVCFPAKKLFQTGLWKEEVHQASFLTFWHRRADRFLSSFITQIAPQLRRVWGNINETITVSICVSFSLLANVSSQMGWTIRQASSNVLQIRNHCQQLWSFTPLLHSFARFLAIFTPFRHWQRFLIIFLSFTAFIENYLAVQISVQMNIQKLMLYSSCTINNLIICI